MLIYSFQAASIIEGDILELAIICPEVELLSAQGLGEVWVRVFLGPQLSCKARGGCQGL